MHRMLTVGLLAVLLTAGAAGAVSPALDSLYLMYADKDFAGALSLLERLGSETRSPAERFATGLELGDYYLDKSHDYARAESCYGALLTAFPRHKQLPDVLYRQALAQEMQEEFLDAARSYEKVATRYSKSTFGQDALDAIERCFRKNYQDRVAYVNGFPITRIELDDRISRNPTAYEPFERKQQLVDTMVETRLLYEAALAAGIQNDSVFVFNLGEQRNRLLFQEWYERQVNARSEPTERELKAAYRKDKAKYTTPERVQASQILVATRAEAESLRALLLADTLLKWDSVARTRSKAPDKDRGGDMGMFARGVHPKAVEDAAFSLKPGQISQPIPVPDGFVILRVVKKTPKTARSFDDVRNQLAVEIRQNRSSSVFDAQIAKLKENANVVQDTMAIIESRETLAVVDGVAITSAMLESRLNAIPPFYRGQFDTPEGKRRILDQLVLERLLVRDVERLKLWLSNRVVDQLLSRFSNMLIDTYRRRFTTDLAQPDSATTMAAYKAAIKDFREPTKAHSRELVCTSAARAAQLRTWAVNGRLPAMASGRALLTADSARAAELWSAMVGTANGDSIAAIGSLSLPPALLPERPMVSVAGRNVADLGAPTKLTGPYNAGDFYAFAFNDLTSADRLYAPQLFQVQSGVLLRPALGEAVPADYAAAAEDSTRYGAYVRLEQPLPSASVRRLFGLDSTGMAPLQRVPGGFLVVKVTRLDTAQKVEFADLVRRYSTSGSKWSGGELWLTRDDKARDAKVVRAAYALSKGGISPVIRLNDSTFTIVKLEEVKPAYTRPFSEVKGKIEPRLRREKETQLYNELVARLRSAATIEVIMKPEDFAPEPEPEPTEPQQPGQNE